jgi:mannose-1-phosphate guanylyltransferase
MKSSRSTWAIILAAGDGTRLADLTAADDGTHTPKQFCSLAGATTLLQDAIDRAARLVDRDRIIVVVAAHHGRWWQPLLAGLPAENVLVQPANRGTGNGLLLALWHLQIRDPAAAAVVLPADHYVGDEAVIERALHRGRLWLVRNPESVLLLGMTPVEADPELGYIVPVPSDRRGIRPVRRFIEKPDPVAAKDLIARGSLWNSFIFAAHAGALLDLFNRRHSDAVEAMRLALARDRWAEQPGPVLRSIYQSLPVIDFSRHVAQGAERALHVLPVPPCGWTDLGTPRRVGQCVISLAILRRMPRFELPAEAMPWPNLARNYVLQQPALSMAV